MQNEQSQPSLNEKFQAPILLEPFAYHKKLRDHFKSRKKTWDWFAEENNKTHQIKEFKSSLLKNTYRLDKESHQNLYILSDDICKQLSIDAEVTFYQENNSVQLNAGISIIDNEAHIVLSGNLLNILSDAELKALIGHELSHYLFYKTENEEFEITQRIVVALANDPRSDDAIIETARVFQLYMELFCDLGALKVCDDYKTTIQTLVKVNTGLHDVNAESYLKQADEILKADPDASQQDSHPESYIRSIALKLSATNDPKYLDNLHKMIQGSLDINCLDIFQQGVMQELTRDLIQCIVTPKWINTSSVLNLCKEYFEDFYKNDNHKPLTELAIIIADSKESIRTYFCYLLMDFAKVDADMEGAPLGFSLEVAELLGVVEIYENLLRKELKISVRDFKLLKKESLSDLQQVHESKDESLYKE